MCELLSHDEGKKAKTFLGASFGLGALQWLTHLRLQLNTFILQLGAVIVHSKLLQSTPANFSLTRADLGELGWKERSTLSHHSTQQGTTTQYRIDFHSDDTGG